MVERVVFDRDEVKLDVKFGHILVIGITSGFEIVGGAVRLQRRTIVNDARVAQILVAERNDKMAVEPFGDVGGVFADVDMEQTIDIHLVDAVVARLVASRDGKLTSGAKLGKLADVANTCLWA